jgi:hypothetical protein
MERTKNVTTGKPRWQKVGGGSLRIGNRIIKPGQIFEALPEEIVPSFRKFVIPLSGDANFKKVEEKETIVIKGIKSKFTMQPHGKSLFLFDVVDANGKVINEKSLKKDVAEKLIEDLSK